MSALVELRNLKVLARMQRSHRTESHSIPTSDLHPWYSTRERSLHPGYDSNFLPDFCRGNFLASYCAYEGSAHSSAGRFSQTR